MISNSVSNHDFSSRLSPRPPAPQRQIRNDFPPRP
nr:MAG TPA: hypothetical protein [Caudoviricetes sp.]